MICVLIKSRRISRAVPVAGMKQKRNAYRILTWEPKRKRPPRTRTLLSFEAQTLKAV
jgi:hypothetical protein